MPRLVIRVPGESQREVSLDQPRTSVGRSAECNIVIQDDEISRTHVILLREGKQWFVEDLDSRNGTFMNDRQVHRQELRGGDVMRLGSNVELQFLDKATPSRAKPRSAAFGLLQRTEWTLTPHGGSGRPPLVIRNRVTTVGRERPANLTIEDESISRLHARIDRRGDALRLTDLKSSNGTFVRGERVMRGEAQDQDTVGFGNLTYVAQRRTSTHWPRILGGVAVVLALAIGVIGIFTLSDRVAQQATLHDTRNRIEGQAQRNLRKGIDAFRRGEIDYARGYLLYASDVVLLADLAPRGVEEPADVLRFLARDLPPADRDFEFGKALDEASVRLARIKLEDLSDRDYVEHEVRRISIELGQDEGVPDGFIDQVWEFVQGFARHKTWMNRVMDRSDGLHDRLEGMMQEAHLPAVFTYVSWVESGLDPRATSGVGARGLWQFMAPTARQYGLRVDRGGGVDERTDVNKSTRAATQYIGNLIRKFGREQFMCALASYNRGEGAVWRAMEKIPDPMMPSSKKYWWLVERKLLPRETSEYVPKIFAVRIIAEDPERFGFQRR